MEKRKDSLSSIKICRFCLTQDSTLTSLYDRNREPKNAVPFAIKILSCVSIEVFPSDKMPAYICNRCKFFMDLSYDYKQICRKADETILQFIQNGTPLEPISWSASLNRTFRNGGKANEVGIMKTVVEGGATVQVTAQEISDSDEDDDENVYNVKIGDGSDDGSKSARVKVITGDEKESAKGKAKKPRKGLPTISKLARHVRSHAGDRPYPCKYCDKSFMKSHHYTRHLRLKHRETIRTARGPFGEADQYRCEQCEDTFATQDDLIYHSAIHATQNLTCPLCQEKFPNVDEVTTHIKSHVNGIEFMCDYCELVFTCKEKLDLHLVNAHEDEIQSNDLRQDDSSMEIDAKDEDDDDDNSIDVKEEDDHMVVEIKKAANFMLDNSQDDSEDKLECVNSEESEPEVTYTELETVDTLAMMKKDPTKTRDAPAKPLSDAKSTVASKPADNSTETRTASILRKAEQIKRKSTQQLATETASERAKEKANSKVESSNSGASDKSLRLLEKELQELKRTNTPSNPRGEAVKPVATLRNKRPQIHTSTPKLRSVEEKKLQVVSKSPILEKKLPERRVITKENKESKEVKEARNTSVKDDKETPKSVVKNGASDKSTSDEAVRRSTRPSKVKDYAKMVRDSSSQESDDNDDDDSDESLDDDEYKDNDSETKTKVRRPSLKQAVKPTPTPAPVVATAVRKRGRPRKDQGAAKIRKEESEESTTKTNKNDSQDAGDKETENKNIPTENTNTESKNSVPEAKAANTIVSPTGQMLKKVPIKSLPPGVKPLPLPMNARQIGSGEVCEMQIGKKVVKVQKIVMTKAEVEAMAKKGLVEMKDGTMVLKQGIKIPTVDPAALKSLVGDGEACKESPSKKEKATPMRCDLGDDA